MVILLHDLYTLFGHKIRRPHFNLLHPKPGCTEQGHMRADPKLMLLCPKHICLSAYYHKIYTKVYSYTTLIHM